MNAHEDFTDYESVLRYCMDKTMGSYDKAMAYGKLQGFFDGNKLTPIGKKIEFKVSNESAWEVGLACGGEIAVYLEQVN